MRSRLQTLDAVRFAKPRRLGLYVCRDAAGRRRFCGRVEGILRFVPRAGDEPERWRALVERTYVGTQDCPALDGVRPIDDVSGGLSRTGQHLPDHWYLVQGVTATTARGSCDDWACSSWPTTRRRGVGSSSTWASFRRRAVGGLGEQIVHFALETAAQGGAARLVLAVDAANEPASRDVSALGFFRVGSSHRVCAARRMTACQSARPRPPESAPTNYPLGGVPPEKNFCARAPPQAAVSRQSRCGHSDASARVSSPWTSVLALLQSPPSGDIEASSAGSTLAGRFSRARAQFRSAIRDAWPSRRVRQRRRAAGSLRSRGSTGRGHGRFGQAVRLAQCASPPARRRTVRVLARRPHAPGGGGTHAAGGVRIACELLFLRRRVHHALAECCHAFWSPPPAIAYEEIEGPQRRRPPCVLLRRIAAVDVAAKRGAALCQRRLAAPAGRTARRTLENFTPWARATSAPSRRRATSRASPAVSRRCLLHGPSGCGKSHLLEAVTMPPARAAAGCDVWRSPPSSLPPSFSMRSTAARCLASATSCAASSCSWSTTCSSSGTRRRRSKSCCTRSTRCTVVRGKSC